MVLIETQDYRKRLPKVVAIDDDVLLLKTLQRFYADRPLAFFAAETGRTGLEMIAKEHPDAVILDNILPDFEGVNLIEQIRQFDPHLPVLLITAQGTSHVTIDAMKRCAFDYLPKPLDLGLLDHRVQQAIQSRELRRRPVTSIAGPTSNALLELLVGRSAPMQQVYKAVGRIAIQDVPVMLVGENGTGKELVARVIHRYSPQAERCFAVMNCSDFSAAWLECELFGHEAGVLPGFHTARRGKLDEAEGGVLFIEDIGEMPLPLQRKLFRFLRDHEYEPVGSTTTLTSETRVIAASSTPLEWLVEQGRFRADLHYLLASYKIRVPSLRERSEDIPALVDHFVTRLSGLGRSFGNEPARVSAEALALLQQHNWPGNIDELQSVLRRALIETKGTVVASDDLVAMLGRREQPASASAASTSYTPQGTDWNSFVAQHLATGSAELYGDALVEMERQILSRVLDSTHGNQVRAAKILGITRGSLRKKILQHGIRLEASSSSLSDTHAPPAPS